MNTLVNSVDTLLRQNLPPELSLTTLLLIFAAGCLLLFLLAVLFFILYFVAGKRAQYYTGLAVRREEENQQLRERLNRQEIRNAELNTQLQYEQQHSLEKLQLLEEAREQLRLQFSDLAQQIFEEKSSRFSELNKERLDAILQPFNNQLATLKQDINEIYHHDTRERLSLKAEIVHLRDMNQQINREAANLTRALKGDTKLQGNWGEMVLERILEQSGLRRGQEYDTQEGYRDPQNHLKKPDVIVHLPDGKDIIIDSKVSLISWERYVNCEHHDEKNNHLQELIRAVRDHIAGLGKKNYPSLRGIRSLDFVLMFMPVESAFHTAFSHDAALLEEAMRHNIVVVTPTTLLATLRTIDNLWQFEQQSKNSLEIARRAGAMYDKFRGFVEEMEKIGRQLAACHSTFDGAMLKLTRGRSNLIAQAEQLRELGVQVKQELPKTIIESSDLDLKN
jgi:DNA recombination protein RmuC